MVKRNGREDAVKLLDFGVAKFGAMQAKSCAGTPGYLAPEVASQFDADARADLYSVGAIAYYMLAGRQAFEIDDPSDLLLAHLSKEPDPPSAHADVHPAFDALVLRALAKRPEDRYESAEDLEAALCEVQIKLGITTPWDDLPIPEVEPGASGSSAAKHARVGRSSFASGMATLGACVRGSRGGGRPGLALHCRAHAGSRDRG